MKIVFFGTPDYVLPILESLYKNFSAAGSKSAIIAVVTQEPKPSGRKKKLEFSAVDSWAYKKKIPICHKADEIIKNNLKADLGILASYGEIISEDVLSFFPKGIINIHPSLLPKYRGSSPVQAAIFCGDEETGVSFTKMDENLDKGQLISQFKEKILPEDTTETLRRRLFQRSVEALASLIPAYLKGKIKLQKLDHFPKTFTWRVTKEDAYLPPGFLNAALEGKKLKDIWEIRFIKNHQTSPTPKIIDNLIRAFQPWPTVWTFVTLKEKDNPKKLKILKAHLEKNPERLVLDEVQLEGKNPVFWKQFKEAYKTAIFE